MYMNRNIIDNDNRYNRFDLIQDIKLGKVIMVRLKYILKLNRSILPF